MIDTHSHLYLEDYDADREQVIARAAEAGVTHVFCPAVSSASHPRLIELCSAYPDFCLPMMGVHPTEINDNTQWVNELDIVEEYLSRPPVRRFWAVGEIGLDLHWSRDFLAEQTAAFERQLSLALRFDLPVAIHSRDAWAETLDVLEKYTGTGLRGVMHAFSGGLDEYHRVRAVGDLVLGVGGPVTYRKNLWISLLPQLDPAHIVLETDAPWLSPTPLRGQRNEPAYLIYIRAAVAEILGLAPNEVDRITTENAQRVFGQLPG